MCIWIAGVGNCIQYAIIELEVKALDQIKIYLLRTNKKVIVMVLNCVRYRIPVSMHTYKYTCYSDILVLGILRDCGKSYTEVMYSHIMYELVGAILPQG
jgi:hypothetical protein